MPDNERPEQTSAESEEQKLDRRTAIAQARALRREAAAKEQEAKAQAAETAAAILENAEPEPPRAPLHKQTAPVPVSNTTGKFSWLDGVSSSEQPDAEELVAQLVEESKQRAAKAAEAAADETPDEAEDYDDDEADDEAYDEAYGEEEDFEDGAYDEEYDEEYDEPYEEEYADEYEEESEEYAEEYADAADDGDYTEDGLLRLTHSEPDCTDRAYYDLVRTEDRMAAPSVRKLMKQTKRRWSKEASAFRAAQTAECTARGAAKWNIAVCLTMLFGIAAGMLFFERPTVSMEENRTLATMPEFSPEGYFSGEFTNGAAEYYNDTVPFRSTFKAWTQKIRKYLGITGETVLHASAPGMQQQAPGEGEPAETTAPADEPAVTGTTAPENSEPDVTVTTTLAPDEPQQGEGQQEEEVQGGELSNNILITDKRGIMLFGGWESMGEGYANILNRFQADLPDVKMYNMVIPTPCSFYTPEEFQYLITSEKANIDYINNHLQGVIPVDAYSALEKHKDEPIFMRTDHHWSSLGAFYAAEEFSAEARVPFARIEEYDRDSREGYVGTLYGFSNDIILKENPEEFFWYVPRANYSVTYYNSAMTDSWEGSYFLNIDNMAPVSWYMIYMSGDDHVTHLQTEVKNGRKLMVIKDSYGNALIPWLTSSFEEIWVVDMRYFAPNAIRFARDKGITDVLFTMNSFSANSGNADKIEEIRVH